MPREWRFSPFDEVRVRTLAGRLKVSSVLAQILAARGFDCHERAGAFLDARLSELYDPERLPGVSAAADAIVKALGEGRRITIYGDYDVDGVTSTSLLWNCLQLAGAKVEYYVPHRLEEGYGLNCEALDKLYERDPAMLVVTVDCGISSVREADHARQIGIELIITDHHEFGPELPRASALVHPRLPGGDYPFAELCGVGVAFKLAWAICTRLGDGKKASPQMREFLLAAVGLAAIGTVADVVPLLDENRVLVRFGLKSLCERSSTGLKALLSATGLADREVLDAEDIGFTIAPRINAAGRLGQARLAVELLTTANAERAVMLANYLEEQNKARQTVERRMLKQAKELVAAHPEWSGHAALVLEHHEWHAGVIGIVASRVAEHYQKPAVLIALSAPDQPGQGSARTFGRLDLHAGLKTCSSDLVTFGGHPRCRWPQDRTRSHRIFPRGLLLLRGRGIRRSSRVILTSRSTPRCAGRSHAAGGHRTRAAGTIRTGQSPSRAGQHASSWRSRREKWGRARGTSTCASGTTARSCAQLPSGAANGPTRLPPSPVHSRSVLPPTSITFGASRTSS